MQIFSFRFDENSDFFHLYKFAKEGNQSQPFREKKLISSLDAEIFFFIKV